MFFGCACEEGPEHLGDGKDKPLMGDNREERRAHPLALLLKALSPLNQAGSLEFIAKISNRSCPQKRGVAEKGVLWPSTQKSGHFPF